VPRSGTKGYGGLSIILGTFAEYLNSCPNFSLESKTEENGMLRAKPEFF
jgi:hypothetical protein